MTDLSRKILTVASEARVLLGFLDSETFSDDEKVAYAAVVVKQIGDILESSD